MGMQVTCPGCGLKLAFKRELLGKKIKCSKCSAIVTLTASTTQPVNPTAQRSRASAVQQPEQPVGTGAPKAGTISPDTGSPPTGKTVRAGQTPNRSAENPPSSQPPAETFDTEAGQQWDTLASDQTASRVGQLSGQFGRYRIIGLLGEGGMGAVYLAEDPGLDRKVAIKIPFLDGGNKAGALDRFRREAKAIAGLQHANICPVYEVSSVDGVHYMAMAFIEGEPLSNWIRADQPLPIPVVIKMVRTIALALDRAHQAGVIHRDLKPDNVVINRHHEPIIMDFGLARREGSGDTKLTKAGQLMGTPAYMSPEQVSGNVDAMGPGCDIYSLGVILYEMLTARLPFDGNLLAVLSSVANDRPPPPSRMRSEIEPRLDEICLKALEKKAEDRFATMGEFARALTAYLNAPAPAPLPLPRQPRNPHTNPPLQPNLTTDRVRHVRSSRPINHSMRVSIARKANTSSNRRPHCVGSCGRRPAYWSQGVRLDWLSCPAPRHLSFSRRPILPIRLRILLIQFPTPISRPQYQMSHSCGTRPSKQKTRYRIRLACQEKRLRCRLG